MDSSRSSVSSVQSLLKSLEQLSISQSTPFLLPLLAFSQVLRQPHCWLYPLSHWVYKTLPPSVRLCYVSNHRETNKLWINDLVHIIGSPEVEQTWLPEASASGCFSPSHAAVFSSMAWVHFQAHRGKMAVVFFKGSERVGSYTPNYPTHFPSHLVDMKWTMRPWQNQSASREDSSVLIDLGLGSPHPWPWQGNKISLIH